MNQVFLIGNLTQDPEIKVTQNGTKLAKVRLAINEGKDKEGQERVQYLTVTAWEKIADVVERFVRKGHKVAVTGSLQTRSWEAQDGSKRSTTDIRVINLEMLTSKAEAERIDARNQSAASESGEGQNTPSSNNSENNGSDSKNTQKTQTKNLRVKRKNYQR
jgi:single-strand DNA-binding protein